MLSGGHRRDDVTYNIRVYLWHAVVQTISSMLKHCEIQPFSSLDHVLALTMLTLPVPY